MQWRYDPESAPVDNTGTAFDFRSEVSKEGTLGGAMGGAHLVLVDRDALHSALAEDGNVPHRPSDAATNVENFASRSNLRFDANQVKTDRQ